MSDQRSSLTAVLLLLCLSWALAAWLVPERYVVVWPPSVLWHKVASVVVATVLSIDLFLAVTFARTE